jgi:hypothetical protein
VLRGDRTPQKALLESLLGALESPADERVQIMDTWARLTEESRERQTDLPRVMEMSPRELGVHAAVRSADSPDELPGYVTRFFDQDLRRLIEDGTQRGCFVVLVGGSSTGKTRSLYEAVRAAAGQWGLAQPSDTGDIYQLLDEPDRPAVVWLDELARFFDSMPALTKPQVARLKRAGHIVVGTLWFDDYTARKDSRVNGPADRELLGFADVIDVPPHLRDDEYRRARKLAATDSSIRAALEATDGGQTDDGLTQVLAAGPELLRLWEHAPPYARAAIKAAADARRLGILSPLSPDLLVEAMAGYLSPADRVASPDSWLQEVTSYAVRPINETTVAPLSKVAGRRSGTLAGYVAADYLAQHLRVQRRVKCPPESFWRSLINRLDSTDDLRRIRDAAAARMRYRLQEQALRRLSALGDGHAYIELAYLLVRQDRIDAAVSVLIECLRNKTDGKEAEEVLARVITLRGRADALRADPITRRHLAELLYDIGESTDLRAEADRGSITAADDLAYLLAERGELSELRQRADAGHRLAADLLAELLATHGRMAELRVRAEAGDQAATARLSRLEKSEPDTRPTDSEAEIKKLREALGRGEASAAERLTSLLFDLGNELELRAEVNAGTQFSVDRLLALLMARRDDATAADEVVQLRAFGLHPDGTLALTEGKDHG